MKGGWEKKYSNKNKVKKIMLSASELGLQIPHFTFPK